MSDKENKLAQFVEIKQEDKKDFAICLWVQRCFENGKTVSLRTDDIETAKRLDVRLWTFDDTSFIPHKIFTPPDGAMIEPVIICLEEDHIPDAEVLIDVAGGSECTCFERFRHIIDFADLFDEDLKASGRRRYKAYQAAGYRMRLIKD